jgi:hypothetical protein
MRDGGEHTQGCNMLKESVVTDLIDKLNAEVNVPFVSEAKERSVIEWLVGKITPHIPEWMLAFMSTAADGITVDEVMQHEAVIVAELNKLVDLPGTPEFVEEKLIQFVVHAILEYSLKGNAIPAA